MNKICIDTRNYDLVINSNNSYFLEIESDVDFEINVLENVKGIINLLVKNSKIKLNINLNKNSSLVINQLGINSSVSTSSMLMNNSSLRYNNSILSNVDSINNIRITHQESDSKCSLYANGINLANNKFYFVIDGIILKDSKNVLLEENSKIINILSGDSKIIPNLIVDNKDVIANHSAFIGTFNEEDIWYLNSRGISCDDAKKLLFKSILFSNMSEEIDYDVFYNFIINNIVI